jgi:hypothetical protein
MQKRGAAEEELEGEGPSKRYRGEQGQALAVVPQGSSALTVKDNEVI